MFHVAAVIKIDFKNQPFFKNKNKNFKKYVYNIMPTNFKYIRLDSSYNTDVSGSVIAFSSNTNDFSNILAWFNNITVPSVLRPQIFQEITESEPIVITGTSEPDIDLCGNAADNIIWTIKQRYYLWKSWR